MNDIVAVHRTLGKIVVTPKKDNFPDSATFDGRAVLEKIGITNASASSWCVVFTFRDLKFMLHIPEHYYVVSEVKISNGDNASMQRFICEINASRILYLMKEVVKGHFYRDTIDKIKNIDNWMVDVVNILDKVYGEYKRMTSIIEGESDRIVREMCDELSSAGCEIL